MVVEVAIVVTAVVYAVGVAVIDPLPVTVVTPATPILDLCVLPVDSEVSRAEVTPPSVLTERGSGGGRGVVKEGTFCTVPRCTCNVGGVAKNLYDKQILS